MDQKSNINIVFQYLKYSLFFFKYSFFFLKKRICENFDVIFLIIPFYIFFTFEISMLLYI